MNSILIFEIKKIIKEKYFLLILSLCLFIFVFTVFYFNHSFSDMPSQKEIANVYSSARLINDNDLRQWITDNINNGFHIEGENIWADPIIRTYKSYLEHYIETNNYNRYIRQTLENATELKTYAVSEQSFYYRNIIDTGEKYSKLSNLTLYPICDSVLNLVTDNKVAEYTLLIVSILIAVLSINKESADSMKSLILITNTGRSRTIFNKLLADYLIIFVISIIVRLFLLIYSLSFFKEGDLLSPIQCIYSFISCPYKINIIEYIIYSSALKTLGYYMLSTIAFIITIVLGNITLSIITCGLIFTLGQTVYNSTAFYSSFYIWKEINITSLFNIKDCFESLHNVNIFGYAFDPIMLRTLLSASIIITLTILSDQLFIRTSLKDFGFFRNIHIRIPKPKNLLVFEIKKLIQYQKILPVTILIIFSIIFTIEGTNYHIDRDEFYYRVLTKSIEQMTSDEQFEHISALRDQMNRLDTELSEFREQYNNGSISSEIWIVESEKFNKIKQKENALVRLEDQLEAIKILNDKGNENLSVVNNTSWQRAIPMTNCKIYIKFFVIIICFCMLSMSGMQLTEIDTGMMQLFSSTSLGEKGVNKKKRLISIVYSTLLVLITNLIHLIKIYVVYGAFPVARYAEITLTDSSLGNMQVWFVFMFYIIFECIIVSACSLFFLRISKRIGSLIPSIAVEFGLFVLPAILILFN